MSVLYIRDASGKFIPVPTISGKDGKTAYQYAQDGGYTGTEAEFAAKLAEEIPEAYTLPVATADRLGGVKVGKGLAMDGETLGVEPEGEYELIEIITVTDDGIVQVSRANEPNGTPYNFTKVLIRNKTMPAGKQDTLNVWFNNTEQAASIGTGSHASNTIYSVAMAWKENGALLCQAANGSASQFGVVSVQAMAYGRSMVKTAKNIEQVSFVYATGMNIPVGSAFEIWGVRA